MDVGIGVGDVHLTTQYFPILIDEKKRACVRVVCMMF